MNLHQLFKFSPHSKKHIRIEDVEDKEVAAGKAIIGDITGRDKDSAAYKCVNRHKLAVGSKVLPYSQ